MLREGHHDADAGVVLEPAEQRAAVIVLDDRQDLDLVLDLVEDFEVHELLLLHHLRYVE